MFLCYHDKHVSCLKVLNFCLFFIYLDLSLFCQFHKVEKYSGICPQSIHLLTEISDLLQFFSRLNLLGNFLYI